MKICTQTHTHPVNFAINSSHLPLEESPYGIMANVMDCNFVVSEFKFQLCYIHLQINTLEKAMNTLVPFIYGLNSTTTVLLQG